MAVTIASINLSGGDTIITIDYNGTFISDPAGAGLTVGTVFYSGLTGLPIASMSGANITLTGQWSPAPNVGDAIGPGYPMGVIVVASYSTSYSPDETIFEFNENGDPYTTFHDVGGIITINAESRTIVAVGIGTGGDGRNQFTVSGFYTTSGPNDLNGDVVTITPGVSGDGGKKPYIPSPGERSVPEVDLIPAPGERVAENNLTPDVRDVPRGDLVPDVINKGNLIPS